MAISKAFIPVAGFGTRFLPASKAYPKEMFPIVDTPALQMVVKEAVDSGITDILLLLSAQKKGIIDHFSQNFELENLLQRTGNVSALEKLRNIGKGAKIKFAFQPKMEGTGGAVRCARDWANGEPFAVLFGDDVFKTAKPVTAQLVDAYETCRTPIIGVQIADERTARKCGVITVGRQKGNLIEVKRVIEKPQGELPSAYASLGRFVLTADVFDAIERTPKTDKGEINITETLSLMAAETGVFACNFDGKRFDIGDKAGFIAANVEFGLDDPETRIALMGYLKGLNL